MKPTVQTIGIVATHRRARRMRRRKNRPHPRARYLSLFSLVFTVSFATTGEGATCPTPRLKSRIGSVRECSPTVRAERRLCGVVAGTVDASTSLMYVASPLSDSLAVIDVGTPTAPRVTSGTRDARTTRRPLDVRLHDSGTYIVVLSGGNTARDKNSTLTIASVEGVNAANGAAPTYAATKSDCVATVRDGRTHYVGSLCGCTAFDLVGDVAYVVCGDVSRLTIVSLPTTAANAATTAMTVLGSIQSELLAEGNAVTVRNNRAYVRSDGVCASCVAVVDVTNVASPTMVGESDVSVVTDVDRWYWTTAFLARGAHRDNATFEYDWIIDPVSSSVTTVSRACVSFAKTIGDSPSACAGSTYQFAYEAEAEANAYWYCASAS